ncbi:TonB-dependent receptor domain-containing protein [Flavobacterium sp. PL02]|uniref:TonB-dependent receptor domain-containing protein n=1 Tax=Flavobacterium sp. PL02 TaxID=3088354 RepID=UPI00057F69E2|nr:TonB-dependent receptor [Flavobacterium sp. PL02]KIC00780.1 TonB-dependent receptor [Flavobacterium sp. JRM]MEA9415378.1 TonB-dependent receptor [Flavobacterium sp. PL02]
MKAKIILLLALALFIATKVTAQTKTVTISGIIKDKTLKTSIPYVNIVLKSSKNQSFIAGTVSNEEGRFTLSNINSGNYILEISFLGYKTKNQSLYVGTLSEFLDLSNIELEEDINTLNEVVVKASKTDEVSAKMDKKVFSVADNITQSGGSVLQSMQSLPGVTVQDGKVQLRGNDKVMVLIDGKQTALTGFGNQSGLDNIPASAIEKIEIINNPSAKFDANGNAGIINIIYKKNKQEGFNGKIGIASGYGSLWERKANLPTIRPQYQVTPKINPSLSLNYRKNKINAYLQADYLYTETLNKNEFVTRTYDDGTVINQQTKRNRDTHFTTIKTGLDWNYNEQNTFAFSGMFGSEKIIDNGDEPFFNQDYSQRLRLWQFLEDELKTTVMVSASYQHKFKEAGHKLNAGINYTYHREDEKYFFDNIMPPFTGKDSFKLLSDEKVIDINVDYIQPLKYGRFETGLKFRNREIPTNMQFFPGINSPLDPNAGGWATYKEIIPALYGNYIFENNKIEAEAGLRVEYVKLQYDVNPNHPTYKSDGYDYTQPFPSLRFGYKINDKNKITAFYNRRVDRPSEVDIRIFPKYDDAEIIKVGNPALKPQFTSAFELGYKTNINKGYLFASLYHRFVNGTISRIATTAPDSNLIYNVFQNANRSSSTGIEVVYAKEINSWYSFNLNGNGYQNDIEAFTVTNLYPVPTTYFGKRQQIFSGNIKWNNTFQLNKSTSGQLSAVYLAPDIIPQGKINSRFSIDLGVKKTVQKGKGEIFLNATDILNTLVIKKEIQGDGFSYNSRDYYETQVVRFGYSYKF